MCVNTAFTYSFSLFILLWIYLCARYHIFHYKVLVYLNVVFYACENVYILMKVYGEIDIIIYRENRRSMLILNNFTMNSSFALPWLFLDNLCFVNVKFCNVLYVLASFLYLFVNYYNGKRAWSFLALYGNLSKVLPLPKLLSRFKLFRIDLPKIRLSK